MRTAALRRLVVAAPLLAVAVGIGGCATGKTHHATSVVDFLYPDTNKPVVQESIPVLTLPLRVGIAFVPGDQSSRSGRTFMPFGGALVLTEKKKSDLMQQVAEHFKKYPFVKSIEIIPSAYLKPRGSFTNLDQLRGIYGVDVIALLSYDQVQFTDEGFLSLTYWTIIGAYIVPGEKNDTHTMLDAVVYDIASRKMLFRAPGTSHVKGRATPTNLSEQLRKDSEEGFNVAAKEMTGNLDQQLALFREKVKTSPAEYKVVRTSGYTGGGSLDGWMLLVVLALVVGLALQRRRMRRAP